MPYLTDDELIERYEYYVMQLEERLLEGEDFKTLIDQIPCMTILSKPEAIEIKYTNKRHEELTGFSLEEVKEECPQYLDAIIHPASLENIRKFLPDFYANQNYHQTMTFIQYVQLTGNSDYSPLVTFTKATRMPDGLVLRIPLLIEEFGNMSPKMEQIVKMDQFKLKHFRRFQQLSDREVEVLRLLANGYNNPQIAEQLFLSRQTVETHRKNLKRKLELRSLRDLMRYAFAFDLVEV